MYCVWSVYNCRGCTCGLGKLNIKNSNLQSVHFSILNLADPLSWFHIVLHSAYIMSTGSNFGGVGMFVCLGSTTSTQHTLGKMKWALNYIQTNHLHCGTVSLGAQWHSATLQETFSFSKASVRISDHANHLRITKTEGMSDVYETHYCVSLDGLLVYWRPRMEIL
jgi:hypothetical protein